MQLALQYLMNIQAVIRANLAKDFSHVNPKELGQSLPEYTLILVLVACLIIAAIVFLGPVVGPVYKNFMCSIPNNPLCQQ